MLHSRHSLSFQYLTRPLRLFYPKGLFLRSPPVPLSICWMGAGVRMNFYGFRSTRPAENFRDR